MSKSYEHLSRDERAAIAIGLEQGLSRRAIARRLSRSPSTISREVRRNGGKRVYHPARARQRREARAQGLVLDAQGLVAGAMRWQTEGHVCERSEEARQPRNDLRTHLCLSAA